MKAEDLLGPQRLGPLTPLVGEWEGNVGIDVSYHNEDDVIGKTGYFEKAWFKPIPTQTNGKQTLEGVKYGSVAWRHGEEAMEPFHDEIGFLLWDKERGEVYRTVVFGRGIAIQAGAKAGARDKEIHFIAEPGNEHFGVVQNPYLVENARITKFESTFKFNDDGTLTHSSNLTMTLSALGKSMQHTDINTLHKVKSYFYGEEQ